MSKDTSERVRLQAIIGLIHFNSPKAVKALLATIELPMDYYIDYALKESFKQLELVWLDMFKSDKNFLADDSAKARYLLLSIPQTLHDPGPGFFKDDPDWEKYARNPLSRKDFDELANVPAVTTFLENQKRSSELSEGQNHLDKGKTIIHLSTLPAKMLFDKQTIKVTAGSDVVLLFDNPDGMAHNVVIIKPGSIDKVGHAAEEMAKTKNGYEKNFVPDLPEVLFATPLVNAGNKFRLEFKAPGQPGDYPFICSFPGHWQVMKGIIKVIKP
jgi:azurin